MGLPPPTYYNKTAWILKKKKNCPHFLWREISPDYSARQTFLHITDFLHIFHMTHFFAPHCSRWEISPLDRFFSFACEKYQVVTEKGPKSYTICKWPGHQEKTQMVRAKKLLLKFPITPIYIKIINSQNNLLKKVIFSFNNMSADQQNMVKFCSPTNWVEN